MAIYYGYSGLKRDFSNEAREMLIQTVKQVNESQWCEVTDYIGDSIQKMKDSMSSKDEDMMIGVEGELLNASEYYLKIVDKNNATEKQINQIFDDVIKEEKKGKTQLEEVYECIKKQTAYIQKLADTINPDNCKFRAEQMAKELEESYRSILEKVGTVMNSVGEEIFGNDEYTLAGELLFALAGEETIEYCEYENMTEEERQQYMRAAANILQELAPYLTLGADFPRIEIPIGGDAYLYYELKASKEFKENEKENYAGLQLIMSNQLASIVSYTLHTNDGNMKIGAGGVSVGGKCEKGNVSNVVGVGTDGSLSVGRTYEYDEGSVTVSNGTKVAKVEVYIQAETKTEEFGTVTSTIGMGQREDEFPTEVPGWEPVISLPYPEERNSFMDNPLEYLLYYPGTSPVPFFW